MEKYTIPKWIDKNGTTENTPLTLQQLQTLTTTHELLESFKSSSWPLGVINVTSLFSIGGGSVIYCYYDNVLKTTTWGTVPSLDAFMTNTTIWPLGGETRQFCLWKVNKNVEKTRDEYCSFAVQGGIRYRAVRRKLVL